MSKVFKIHTNPYDEDEKLFDKATITLQPGVTVLVGPNGSGKSTLQLEMQRLLRKEDIDYVDYDNVKKNNRSDSLSTMAFFGDYEGMGTMLCSSEGQGILQNMGRFGGNVGQYIRECKKEGKKEAFVFIDAMDSGLSIDNIDYLKRILFQTILDDTKDVLDAYIIVSANMYEVARGEMCFDVKKGKYCTFDTYEKFRNFVLSRSTLND